MTCHPVPRRILEAQDPGSDARMETSPGDNQESSKGLVETRNPNVHSAVVGKDADEHSERTITSNLGRRGTHTCQNVGTRGEW